MEVRKLKAQLEPLIAQKQEVDKNAHRWGCSGCFVLPLGHLLLAKLSVAHGRVVQPELQGSYTKEGLGSGGSGLTCIERTNTCKRE